MPALLIPLAVLTLVLLALHGEHSPAPDSRSAAASSTQSQP
jgi:hypothetical protein